MSAQVKSQHSSMRQSLDVPMSAFNKHLIEEVGKLSVSKERISRGYSNGSRGRRTVCLTSLSQNDHYHDKSVPRYEC